MKCDFFGVYPMLIPFYTTDDQVDHSMWQTQIDIAIQHGSHGIAVMGLGTEVNKLSGTERRETLESVSQALAGRLPLSVTVGENTANGQIEFGRFAQSCGAAWLILQPPAVSDLAEIELLRFFGKVADAVSLPIAVQNAAAYLGVQLSAQGLLSLHRQHPNICLLKTEDTADISARLVDETNGTFRLFVGRSGMEMIDELRAGAAGIIPGVETIDRTPQIFDDVRSGREWEAEVAYREILPTLSYLVRSINHFVIGSREILARRLGVSPVRHRLGKDLGRFGLEMIDRYAESLGKLSIEKEPQASVS